MIYEICSPITFPLDLAGQTRQDTSGLTNQPGSVEVEGVEATRLQITKPSRGMGRTGVASCISGEISTGCIHRRHPVGLSSAFEHWTGHFSVSSPFGGACPYMEPGFQKSWPDCV